MPFAIKKISAEDKARFEQEMSDRLIDWHAFVEGIYLALPAFGLMCGLLGGSPNLHGGILGMGELHPMLLIAAPALLLGSFVGFLFITLSSAALIWRIVKISTRPGIFRIRASLFAAYFVFVASAVASAAEHKAQIAAHYDPFPELEAHKPKEINTDISKIAPPTFLAGDSNGLSIVHCAALDSLISCTLKNNSKATASLSNLIAVFYTGSSMPINRQPLEGSIEPGESSTISIGHAPDLTERIIISRPQS